MKYFIEDTTLTSIADSIRYAEGSEDLVPVDEMAERVKARVDVENSLIERGATEYINNISEEIRPYCFNRGDFEYVEFGSVIYVHYNAFYNCTKLKSVIFHAAKAIAANAFVNCSALIAVVIDSDEACDSTSASIFSNTPIAEGKGWIYVKSNFVEELKAKTNWTVYADQIVALEDYELKIVTQPTDVVGAVSDEMSLEVVVMAIGVKYQWQYSTDGGNKWNNLNAGTSRIFTASIIAAFNGYQYRCIIQDKYGSEVITDAITVTVAESEVAE